MHCNAQTIVAGIALVGVIVLSILFVIHPVPEQNHDYLVFTLGALAGAITVAGGSRMADQITNKPRGDVNVSMASDPPADPPKA
jgi:hypothetical protein